MINCHDYEAEVAQPGKARAWKARGNFPSGVQISPSALLISDCSFVLLLAYTRVYLLYYKTDDQTLVRL